MASKLQEITSKYHTFVDNQVLTKDQLNEFVSYFDDQDRLSRVFLSGVGLVCGFTLSRSGANIVISHGVGLTTDGDLLLLQNDIENSALKKLVTSTQTFTHYSQFSDDWAGYAPFRKLSGSEEMSTQQMDLYELHTGEADQSLPLSELENIDDKVVLLYLESYADSGDLCTSLDCDNQGIAQINRLRVLLVSQNDAELIAANDTVYSRFNKFASYSSLPEVAVKRVVLDEFNTLKYEALKEAYSDAITSNDIVGSLSDAIRILAADFGELLQLNLSETALKKSLATLENLFGFQSNNVPFDIQYRYDLLKDLVDTYNELKGLLLHLSQNCFPDIAAFPKHLMLGLLSEINSEHKKFRHKFYPSPLSGGHNQELGKAKSLALKLIKLITNYKVVSGDLRITPSLQTPDAGKRSIPFYYSIDPDFLKVWDYAKTQQFRELFNLSYHTEHLSSAPQVQEPLNYNSDRFDFYRIEGHQGKNYTDVLIDLDRKKKEYGLSFDVKALSVNISTDDLDIDDYDCEFEDLKMLLTAWTTEQDCVLAEVSGFFSGFSTKVPGANVKEAELDLKKVSDQNLKFATHLATADLQPVYSFSNAGKANSQLYLEAVKGKVVQDNLSLAEDTLGVEMYEAIEEAKGGSVNDIIASATQKLQLKIDDETWDAEPELKDFVVNKSVELMAHTYVLTQQMPTAVNVVDSVRVTEYKLSLEQLCSLVKRLKASYQSAKLSVGLQAFTGLLINQLSTVCCSGKKLEVLLDEVNTRKNEILARLQLSKFIEQHPGLEHKAGVEPGGTFVLVYKNSETSANAKEETLEMASDSLSLSANMLSDSKRLISEKILNIETLSSAERNTVLRSATELLKTEDLQSRLKSIELLGKYISTTQVPDNTVIADFALPYMCCSDCAPINYIVAKSPVTLRLSRDTYCLLNDNDPVLFEVSPADGEVEMSPDVAGINIENKKLVISADNFPEEMLGKAIRFTVNKQVTDAVLTVYPGIITDFSVPAEPTAEATHRFVPEGKLESASFYWEFGDGVTSTDRNPTHTYKLPVNEKNTATVRLTVTAANGVCQISVAHPIVFAEIETKISLKNDKFCENDKGEYPFMVTPENAKVEISGDGVIPNNAGGFSFIPAATKPDTVSFLVNGSPSDYSVTVFAAPQAACSPKQEGNQLIISNTSKNASNFTWTINGAEKQTTTLDPLVIHLTPNSPTSWKITLLATGADVCSPSRTSTSIVTKYVDETPVDTCADETAAAIIADARLLQSIKADAEGILEATLAETLEIYGGSRTYSQGVIDQMTLFLSGAANDSLEKMFFPVLNNSVGLILELANQPELQARVMELFELQLRLFYNVLACQSNDAIKIYAGRITTVLELIIDSLSRILKQKLIFSDAMKGFVEQYATKVSDRILLGDHMETILSKKLI